MSQKHEVIQRHNGLYDAQLFCSHCGEAHIHEVAATNLPNESSKDSVWGKTIAVFGCECCRGITALSLWHHKGNVFLQINRGYAQRGGIPDPSKPFVNVEVNTRV